MARHRHDPEPEPRTLSARLRAARARIRYHAVFVVYAAVSLGVMSYLGAMMVRVTTC